MKQETVIREWVKWVIFIALVYFIGAWLLDWHWTEVTLNYIIWDGVCK